MADNRGLITICAYNGSIEQTKRPEALRSDEGVDLQSQQVLVAGMLRKGHFLDLIHNFSAFQQVDGKTRKIVARYQQFRAIHKAVEKLQSGRTVAQGADRDERGGIIWHTQGSGKSLSMVFLVRKMRMTQGLKDFKVVAVTDRTSLEGQLRETARLSGEAVRPTDEDRKTRLSSSALTQKILSEETPDIVFAMLQKYQQSDRKLLQDGPESVSMTIVRKEKKPGREEPVVEKQVTFRESVQVEDFPELNRSEKILVLVDEAHRGHTKTLNRNLRKALPNAAFIGFTGTPILSARKKETREIFGDFIDKYLLQDAELDGATVPILYEGRTADGIVKNATSLDQLFEDMFRDYTEEELAVIKAKYGTEDDILEAPLLIEKKARDMMRHYAGVVLPEGFKAQVVATNRPAAITYREKLLAARDELVKDIEALPVDKRDLSEDEIEKLDEKMRFLVKACSALPLLKALEVATCVDLLADLKIRAEFINKLRLFYETLNILEHRAEVPADVFRDAKLLGFINKVAANLYRDPALNLLGVAEKVKALINKHISARGVDPKIPPTTITDAEFEKILLAQSSSRARATHMQHAARYHIMGFRNQNPFFPVK